ncbi:MAG: cation:proton antiporter, partial [Varibaculum timonense]
METLHFVVVVLSFVLLSSVLDQMISRVSLPLVQIGIGLLMAVFISGPLEFSLDPELFLVLFIAPLLYDESRNVSKRLLYRHFSAVLNLAIGLVICSCLAVGFFLNYLEPSIPLTVAFALGAALGPTDAVAVGALSGTVKLNSRQSTLLAGEALINDASGIVSFQFAVAAAVTGAFSLTNAAGAFAVSFLGGLSLGVLLGIISLLILKAVRGIGLESTVFHVTFELLSPLVFFIIAEELHVSGILAVVAGGLLVTLLPQRTSAFAARVRLVSGSVWEVVAFILNGIVFIMLGTQIPGVFNSTWRENS